MRDHKRLTVFQLADDLVEHVYRRTIDFPRHEQFGLTSQIRRAAVSIAANIVEGSARNSETEYLRFLNIAYGSARELEYEIDLCRRLGYLQNDEAEVLSEQCVRTSKNLCALILAIRRQ